MRKMSRDEYKEVILNILLKVHKFCRENEINYSLSCGTLLGAVRHKGFIPWDDDIDIQLLRDDYNKLIQLFPQEYEDISLVSLERDSKWDRAYAKAYDGTTIEVEALNSKKHVGVGIDVVPIDNVPDSYNDWLKYNKKRLLLQKIYSLKSMKFRKSRSLSKNLALALSRLVLFPFPLRFLALRIDKMAKKFNAQNTSFLFENCQGIGKRRNRFHLKDFEGYIDMEFEGHYLKAPQGYDDYLTQTYGNYMQLPPKNQQVPHHSFEAYWK